MTTFKLPDLGEGLQEAEIVAWHVGVGDHVVVDQPLVSVETEKAVVEIPSTLALWSAKFRTQRPPLPKRRPIGDVLAARPRPLYGSWRKSLASTSPRSRQAGPALP